ncbi:MAG: hypothetical protein ACRDNW_20020 [Trebonia sp.]
MKSSVAHWGARDWRRNVDALVPDSAHPQAFPSTYPMDLMGRIRVKLAVEDGNLVAYGFGGQRIVIPPASVGGAYTVGKFRFGWGITHNRALLIVGRDNRVLLRANGLWETYGEVSTVCGALGVDQVEHVNPGNWRNYQFQARRSSASPVVARFKKAPGYRRLRTHPRGRTLRALTVLIVLGLTMGWGGYLGTLPAMALPLWFGAVRTLFAIVGVVLGVCAGLWVGAAITHIWSDVLRWAGTSLAAGSPVPVRQFFTRRREYAGTWLVVANVGLTALFIALCGWGPGVLIASTTHGVRDSSLVAGLRANGVTTQGQLIDKPNFGLVSASADVPTLAFTAGGDTVKTTDPSIGGKPLPLDASDPLDSKTPETVVYLPDNPEVAAARQQITGSVWHGAPTANVISGAILTLSLPPLLVYLVLRLRRLRRRRAKGLVEDLSA